MGKEKDNVLNKSIRKVTWPNFIEGVLEDELFCYTIGQVLDLTDEKLLKTGLITTSEIFGICNNLILLDSNLFYKSKLYSSLESNKTFNKMLEQLNKTSEVSVNI